MTDQQVLLLLQKYKEGNCNVQEREFLELWYLKRDVNAIAELSANEFKEDLLSIGERLPLVSQRRTYPLYIHIATIAAAVVILTTLVLFYFFPVDRHQEAYADDIAPGSDKAILTLASGEQINLSDTKNGTLTRQSGIEITKSPDGVITYRVVASTQESPNVTFNTLRTPPAGQIRIILSDGSKVWLNAASSLKYPISFNGSEEQGKRTQRYIELSGEAYFEVAKDQSRPFVVLTEKQEVTVIGTHFNISAYNDELITKTTLLEGSVKVAAISQESSIKNIGSENPSGIILKPNEQSSLSNNKISIREVDPDEAVAWKEGKFLFRNEPLEQILNKISRWYDVEIVYQNKALASQKFSGIVARSENISRILRTLESAGEVHFKIEGRKVTVMK